MARQVLGNIFQEPAAIQVSHNADPQEELNGMRAQTTVPKHAPERSGTPDSDNLFIEGLTNDDGTYKQDVIW